MKLLSFFVLWIFCSEVMAQGDSLSQNSGMVQGDSLVRTDSMSQGDSLAKKDSVSQGDSLVKNAGTAQKDTPLKNSGIENNGLKNITQGNKKIRAYGWGEYRVGGRCLCCDNKNDGDCIVVQTIERTDRERITQIVDGQTAGDTNDTKTYFGNLRKRDLPEYVNLLMVDISLGKVYEVRKVVVYTIMDKEQRAYFLSNCELGYYDQFSRLQWTGKVESKKYDEPITFELEHPVLTKAMMLRVKGGKNRITEVAIFGESQKE